MGNVSETKLCSGHLQVDHDYCRCNVLRVSTAWSTTTNIRNSTSLPHQTEAKSIFFLQCLASSFISKGETHTDWIFLNLSHLVISPVLSHDDLLESSASAASGGLLVLVANLGDGDGGLLILIINLSRRRRCLLRLYPDLQWRRCLWRGFLTRSIFSGQCLSSWQRRSAILRL